ncbi:MAG: YggT family protein [Fusobacteriota bacterium]
MAGILILLINVIEALIFIRIILSWIVPTHSRNEFVDFINGITEPILAPFRVLIPIGRMGRIDISPLIVLLLLNFISNFIHRIF